MKERVDTYQVQSETTKAAVIQNIQAKGPEFLAEAKLSANGRNIHVQATIREYDTLDGLTPCFTGHIYMELTDDPVSAFNPTLVNTITRQEYDLMISDSPAIEE